MLQIEKILIQFFVMYREHSNYFQSHYPSPTIFLLKYNLLYLHSFKEELHEIRI